MSASIDTKFVGPIKEFMGRRCFIVGSGPSLDDLDLASLRGQVVWALNASATLFDDRPGLFWLLRDRRAIREILPRLAHWKRMRVVTHVKAFSQIETDTQKPRHAYVYEERSVVHTRTIAEDALQLARRAGCSDAVLVGVDCKAPPGRPYAKALDWKDCAWYDRKDPVPESKACASMRRALADLATSGVLGDFPVYSASVSLDVFPHLEYAHAVAGRTPQGV